MLNSVVALFNAGAAAGGGAAYESIATVSVGSGGSSSVSFTSIPGIYAHLQIRALIKQSNGDGAYARLNSDSGNNYTRHRLQGNGSTASAFGETGQNRLNINTNVGYSDFGVLITDILDYANTNKYKTVRHFTGIDKNGSGAVLLESGLWMDTSAVTSITFINPNTGNYSQYSHFALYGIKGA